MSNRTRRNSVRRRLRRHGDRRDRLGQRGSRGRDRRRAGPTGRAFQRHPHRTWTASDDHPAAARRRQSGRDRTPRRSGRRRAARGRADGVRHRPRSRSRTCAAATGRPATRTTGSTPTSWPTSLRTDRARLRPLTRDSEQTITLRMAVRARQDLVHARVAMANQLRAHLQTTLPGAIGLFRDIDSAITLRFLARFPSQDKADWLSHTRLGQLAALDRLQPPGQPRPALGAPARRPARNHRPPRHSPRRDHARAGRRAHRTEDPDQGTRGPDRRPARRPPRRRDLHLAAQGRHRPRARLLAEIGDARGRFPTPEALACLAGATPRPNSPARSRSSRSDGPSTSSCAAPSSTSPATPITPTPGPPTSTPKPEHATTTTPTRPASWPAPGSTSSGAAGKTASPTTPPNTTPSNAFSTRRLDTGLLMPRPRRPLCR